MREVSDVLARPDLRRNLQRAREEAAAPGGIDEQIRLASVEPRRLRERFGGEAQTVRAHPLELRPRRHSLRSEFRGALVEQAVERGAWRIVGVGRQRAGGDGFKAKVDLLTDAEGEGHAGLVLAERGHALLDPQLAQHGDDRRNERFADEQIGPAASVEERHLHAPHGEERGQRAAGGAAPDDRDGVNAFAHGLGITRISLTTDHTDGTEKNSVPSSSAGSTAFVFAEEPGVPKV